MTEQSKARALIEEARELLKTHSIVAMRVDKPYREIRPLITSLCDELDQQVSLNKTQSENIVEFQREQDLFRDALRGVAIILNTELAKHEDEPWAQRVGAKSESVFCSFRRANIMSKEQIMPLPYVAEVGESLSDNGDCWVIDSEQGSVAEMQCAADVQEATAKYMVRATNNHAALVAAVRHALAIENSVTQGQEKELRAQAKAIYESALEAATKERDS